jgi:tRNA (guanine37-N1)-methyltransferase
MIIDVLTTFPGVFDGYMSTSIMGRAQQGGALRFSAHDLRDYTHDRHRTTDDDIYGGGQGLLMKPEPVYEALDDLRAIGPQGRVILFAPTGEPFSQAKALQFAAESRLIMVCGHYEGLDERIYALADDIVSLGDYVLTGGELAAMVVADAVVRLLPGVLGDEGSSVEESFGEGLLEFPQYTRPATYRDMSVPDVLLSGDHGRIDAWKRRAALRRTALVRPDLLATAPLSQEERDYVAHLMAETYDSATMGDSPDGSVIDYTVARRKGGAHGQV